MDSATAWKVRGVGRETRVFAEDAARRAGLSLGDWLDEVIAERADERGVDPADLRRDDRLDAIGERITRLARRDERFDEEPRHRPRLEPRWTREAPSRADPRRNDDLLEATIARLEERAERAEALQAAAERLSAVEHRVERTLEPRARDLDMRLDALARRVESEPQRRREPVRHAERPQAERPIERPRFDPQEAAAQIARRRDELDQRAALRPVVQEALAPAPAPRAPASANVDMLREEIRTLSTRLEQMRREPTEQAAPAPTEVKALRSELAAMSRSLADLAPRNAVVALEGAMRDLGERIAGLRDSGARDALAALIVEVRESLRAHDPQAAVAGLEREIRAIDVKVDAIAQGVIDPAVLHRIRVQTEEVRNLLAAAAARPVPVDRLEKQMGELADRVDRLAGSPAPQAESARVGVLLADARAQIERSTPTTALAAIERRLEDLAKRMDQALQRPAAPAPIDPRAFDDLARRIDGVRASVERQTDPGKLEQALRAIGERPIEIDTAPIEAMMRELGAKMMAPATPDMRPFEGMLREISLKLDGRAASAPSGELAATIRELGQRIDERVGPPMDTRSLEAALRALHDRLESSAPARLDVKFVEEAADLLAERLERRSGPSVDADTLAGQIAEIHDRLDGLQSGGSASAGLEQRVEDLIGELDATRQALQAPTAPAGGQFFDGLAELRADQDEADKRTQSRLGNVQDILERMVGRLGRLEDEIARVDDAYVAEPRVAALASAPSLALPAEPFRAVGGAALRDVPERSPAPASRAIDGADFLLEPGATRGRPRIAESADATAPKSAINAHIAAARRAAQAAMGESPASAPAQAAAQGQSGLAALGGRAVAFAGPRRRPLLLAAAVIAAVAMLAVIELRGGHVPLLQKSELEAVAAKIATLASPPSPAPVAPAPTLGAANLDTSPTGAISAPKAPPADLMAAIPAGLSQSLHDSAAAGDVGAEFELALRLLDGRGVTRDPHAAAQWFEQAANRGLPIAEYRLAALYEKGIGVTRDLPNAMSLYVKAATAGNARAMHNLAVMHAEGSIGGKPDYATAAEWFRKAGSLGVRDSQFNLGILYARGLGGAQDLGQAWLWFSLAAQQGDADSGRKRDDIAAKMDPAAVNAAAAALGAFKVATPLAAANEAPTPPGGWDGKTGSQASTPAKPATAM